MRTGFSPLRRERMEREEAERLARAITLEVLDGVLTFARRERLATCLSDGEVLLLAGLADCGRSAHSLRALAEDLESLSRWCIEQTNIPLPFPPDEALLTRFLKSQRAENPAPSQATLKRRISSWAALTRASGGHDAVFTAPAIRTLLGRRTPVRQKTKALGEEGLARLLSTCAGDSLTDRRDHALLITAFTLGLRPAEITALQVIDFSGGNEPFLRIGARHLPLPEAVAASIGLWLAQTGLAAGPLFRPVDRWGKPGKLGLTPQSLRLVVRARGQAAGLDASLLRAGSLR